jgi:hypothetical protein
MLVYTLGKCYYTHYENASIHIRKMLVYTSYVILGDPGVDGRIILRLIFGKWDLGVWTRSSWLRIGTGGRHL